jgi:hypothetical protein
MKYLRELQIYVRWSNGHTYYVNAEDLRPIVGGGAAAAAASAAGGAFVVGARVRVVCEKPAKGWGSVKRYDEGVLKSVSGADCVIDFDKHKGWAGLLSELQVVAGTFSDQTLDVLPI